MENNGTLHGYGVDGRYRLENMIGTGSTCEVWSARNIHSNEAVAIKLLSSSTSREPETKRRFLRESALVARCNHPGIVRSIASGKDSRVGPYLVMELLRGETLEQRLQRVGPVSSEEFLGMAKEIADALGYLHASGIVHRDLKPANIFLQEVEGQIKTKLLDFGTVKESFPWLSGVLTGEGDLVGTLSRMSPEQARGNLIDHRTDLWAFAMIAFESLVGCPAVDGTMPSGQVILAICFGRLPMPSHLHAGVPPALDAWFSRCTQPDPEMRFENVHRQWEALLHALAPEPIVVRIDVLSATAISMPPLLPRKPSPTPFLHELHARGHGKGPPWSDTVPELWLKKEST